MKNFSKHKNLISFAILIPFCFLPFAFLNTNFKTTSNDNFFIKRSSSNASKQQRNDTYSIEQISAGDRFSAALITDGNKDYLYTWGENVSGALGLGDKNNRNFPTLVTSLPEGNIEQISTGWNHTAAVIDDGNGDQLYTWGFNNVGQLGVKNIDDFNGFTIPQEVTSLPEGDIEQISLGYYHSAAVVNDGSGDELYTWGSNTRGQLGHRTITNNQQFKPTKVEDLPSGNIKQISLGNDVSAAIVNENGDDHLYTWGANDKGQLGYDTQYENQVTPKEVTDLPTGNIEQISMGYDNSAAVINNNGNDELWTWGDNSDGQLGLGTTTNKPCNTPQKVENLPKGNIKQIDLGGSRNYESNPYSAHSAAIVNDENGDKLYTWGNNELGQLGLGENKKAIYNFPQEVTTLPDGEIKQVALGGYHSIIAINSENNDYLYAWGNNDNDQLGFGKKYIKYIYYSDDSIPYYPIPYETYFFKNWYLQHWYYIFILILIIIIIWIIIAIWIIKGKKLSKFTK